MSLLAGDFSGKSAYLDYSGRIFEQLEGTIEVVEIHDVLVGEDTLSPWSRSGRCAGNRALRKTTRRVGITGGKIAETWSRGYDLYALDVFWF